MTSSPLNLHVHGVHVSPKGNADNVMLHIPAGMSNTYTYNIPKNMPQGAYWYHSHLHTLTTPHVYYGMAGLLAIGRTDGNLPLVTQNQIPIRNMVLQYNYVFDRAGGLAQLNNSNWPQWVSTIKPPEGDELAKGTYRPLLAPVNFAQSKKGTQFFTIWYSGPLSIRNERGRFRVHPEQSAALHRLPGGTGKDVPADPALPDYQRDVQFTVNGQFQPVIKSKAGPDRDLGARQCQRHRLHATCSSPRRRRATIPKIAIVGQDGIPYPEVHYPVFENGTRLLIPPATRYAIAVTMPDEGDLILEMPPRGGGATTISAPGVLYTNDGTENPPAVLGSLSVLPVGRQLLSTGSSSSPTQVLARATTSGGKGVTTRVQGRPEARRLHRRSRTFRKVTPDVKRELTISGGFLNNLASTVRPQILHLCVRRHRHFPMSRCSSRGSARSRNGRSSTTTMTSIRSTSTSTTSRSTHYFDPTTGLETGPEMWAVDNANVPAPTLGRRNPSSSRARSVAAHEVRRFHRPLRDALPSPQPRRQRADDAGQCHPRRLDLCGGGSRIAGTARPKSRSTTATATGWSPRSRPSRL